MSKEELMQEIEKQEEAMFLEQMKDYMDHDWYRKARGRLNILKEMLNEKEKEEILSEGYMDSINMEI